MIGVFAFAGPAASAQDAGIALTDRLLSPDPVVRRSAQDEFLKEAIPAITQVQKLLFALKQGDARVRQRVVEALQTVGPLTEEVMPAFDLELKDDDPAARAAAETAIEKWDDGSRNRELSDYRKGQQALLEKKIAALVPKDLKDLVITISRSQCLGTCPEYKMTIVGSREVTFEGAEYVKAKGTSKGVISEIDLRALLVEFAKVKYPLMHSDYTEIDATDCPGFETELLWGDVSKKIMHYSGDDTAPKQLRELEDEIDARGGSSKWIGDHSER
ncbi:MAG: DUF6438 domain-containing protein [Elusimicrobiota bacterium]